MSSTKDYALTIALAVLGIGVMSARAQPPQGGQATPAPPPSSKPIPLVSNWKVINSDNADKLHIVIYGSPQNGENSGHIDINNASIKSLVDAKAVVDAFFSDQGIDTKDPNFGCIIHVVKWGLDPKNTSRDIVAKSNWFVYNTRSSWSDSDVSNTKRLYGLQRIYILAIHLAIPTDTDQYIWNYTYNVTHRLPANVQDLVDVVGAFGNLRKAKSSPDVWAIGALQGDPPSSIAIAASVVSQGTAINFDSAQVSFDNEGLYRWDISIAVPITSVKQGQSLVDSSGQLVTANVDTRSVLVLANWFLKPVDIKTTNFLAVPHLVGGVALQSKPLKTALVGLGWGPAVANFYVGVLIVTSDETGARSKQNYKLGFGLNVPVRLMAAKLGLKSQVQ